MLILDVHDLIRGCTLLDDDPFETFLDVSPPLGVDHLVVLLLTERYGELFPLFHHTRPGIPSHDGLSVSANLLRTQHADRKSVVLRLGLEGDSLNDLKD